jgi:hypothetical protein
VRNCGNCRFFSDGSTHTHCRRFPPTVLSADGSAYPLVPAWAEKCGEHRLSLYRLAFKRPKSQAVEPELPLG